jgi:hypothetical protein
MYVNAAVFRANKRRKFKMVYHVVLKGEKRNTENYIRKMSRDRFRDSRFG